MLSIAVLKVNKTTCFVKEMTSHRKSAAIQDSFGHKGAFFLADLHYTESLLGLLSVIMKLYVEIILILGELASTCRTAIKSSV